MNKKYFDRKLSEKQAMAIPLVLAGLKDYDVAKEVGVTRQTVNKWKNQDLEFIDYLNYYRALLQRAYLDEIHALIPKAVRVLTEALEGDDQNVKIDVAKMILKEFKFTPMLPLLEHPETVRERKKECINTGGEKVFPLEVEEILQVHPKIYEVCVIGVPDEEWGSTVRAVVQLKDGEKMDLQEIKDFCRDKIAGYKIPRSAVFVDEIPFSPAGKMLRQKIRDSHGQP